jgi:hypothetical protein
MMAFRAFLKCFQSVENPPSVGDVSICDSINCECTFCGAAMEPRKKDSIESYDVCGTGREGTSLKKLPTSLESLFCL